MRFVPYLLVTVFTGCSAGDHPNPGGDGLDMRDAASDEARSSATNPDANVPDAGAQVESDDGGAATSDADAETDSPLDAEAAGPCDGVQHSLNVAEYQTEFAPPPAAGGTIEPGEYVLNEVTTYTAPDDASSEGPPDVPTGTLVRATIYVTATTFEFVQARGTDDGDGGVFAPDSVTGDTYVTSGTSLMLTAVCPTAGATSTLPYTASDNLLTLYVSATEYERFHLAF